MNANQAATNGIGKVSVPKLILMGRTGKLNELQAGSAASFKNPKAGRIFAAGGKRFIIANAYDDENDGFYVVTEDVYGSQRVFDASTPLTNKFDPNNQTNVAYFLNNDFLTSGNDGAKLPQDIIDYINTDHTWWTSAFSTTTNGTTYVRGTDDYPVTGGIALMGVYDYGKYLDKVGWGVPSDSRMWWLRDQRSTDGGNNVDPSVFGVCAHTDFGANTAVAIDANVSNYKGPADISGNNKCYIRPTFFLKKDFFRNVKLNVNEIGADVRNMLADFYTIEEMRQAGYSDSELVTLGLIQIPVVEGLKMDGSFRVGEEITASYTITNVTEGDSQFGFEISSSANGTYVPVADNLKTYTVQSADLGKYIRFYLIPKDSRGNTGDRVTTAATIITSAEMKVISLNFTDAGGTNLPSLSGAARLYARTEFENTSNAAADYFIMIYLYNKDGKKLANKTFSGSVSVGGTRLVDDAYLDLPSYIPDTYAKAFVWSSLGGMRILSVEPALLR